MNDACFIWLQLTFLVISERVPWLVSKVLFGIRQSFASLLGMNRIAWEENRAATVGMIFRAEYWLWRSDWSKLLDDWQTGAKISRFMSYWWQASTDNGGNTIRKLQDNLLAYLFLRFNLPARPLVPLLSYSKSGPYSVTPNLDLTQLLQMWTSGMESVPSCHGPM